MCGYNLQYYIYDKQQPLEKQSTDGENNAVLMIFVNIILPKMAVHGCVQTIRRYCLFKHLLLNISFKNQLSNLFLKLIA